MTYGVHPHSASQYDDALEKEIEQAMSHPRTVAWVLYASRSRRSLALLSQQIPLSQGECGLDFFKNLSEQEVQKAVFARQLQKAVEHKKPLVIHSRNAEAVLCMPSAELLNRCARFADDQHRHNEQDTVVLVCQQSDGW